jgi:hypothetical protein
MFGGDDGIAADIDTTVYARTCKQMGLKVKAEPLHRGQPGVMFLARVYGPDVWFNDPNSCCDLVRQLSKFHTSVPLPSNISPETKLVEKSRGFALSDGNTPIIGPFVKTVIAKGKAMQEGRPELAPLRPYLSRYTETEQYPNEPCEWMEDYVSSLNFQRERFENWLAGSKRAGLKYLLSPPLLREVEKPKAQSQSVVVDLETIDPARKSTGRTKTKDKRTKRSSNHAAKARKAGPSE